MGLYFHLLQKLEAFSKKSDKFGNGVGDILMVKYVDCKLIFSSLEVTY